MEIARMIAQVAPLTIDDCDIMNANSRNANEIST
jgi:hypothetical protein